MNSQNTYIERRENSNRTGRLIGAVLVLCVLVCSFTLLSFTGLSYIYPPPEESSFLLDFSSEVNDIDLKTSKEPVSENVDKSKEIELVKKSESPIEQNKPNTTEQSAQDDFGDVETPAPQVEQPVINQKALFPGMSKKPSSSDSPHSASKSSTNFSNGQSDGNSKNNTSEGRANAHLKGRKDVGGLALPKFNKQEGGKVVVRIWVDAYGNVTNAIVDASGTTIDDKTLWNEARNAAMKTHFTKLNNITEDTPLQELVQEGTITYYFTLK